MDKLDASGHSRRQVLQTFASAGAAVTAAAVLPASAQETVGQRAGSGNQSTIAQTLADYAVKLRYEDLPAEVVRTVKRTIIDTIGCAIGGYEAGPSQIALGEEGSVAVEQHPDPVVLEPVARVHLVREVMRGHVARVLAR